MIDMIDDLSGYIFDRKTKRHIDKYIETMEKIIAYVDMEYTNIVDIKCVVE